MTSKKEDVSFYKLNMAMLPDELYKDGISPDKWLELAETTEDPKGFSPNSLNKLSPVDPVIEWERIVGIAMWMALNIFPFAVVGLAVTSFFFVIARYVLVAYLMYVIGLCAIEYFYFVPIFRKKYNIPVTMEDNIRENQYNLYTERNTSKYVSTNIVWPQSIQRPALGNQPVIFCLVPHGVAPFGATSYPLWSKIWTSKLCRWTCAEILFAIPFVGFYMSKIGYIPAKTKQILETLQKKEESVGVFLDGIAGMFQVDPREERAFLKKRKGIVKIALRAGVPIIPVYAFGHSATYDVWVDPFGILEYISNATQVSLVPFFGRYGWFLGPPKRVPVTLCLGDPIKCPLTQEPTKAEIDEYHTKMVDGFTQVFEQHKEAYGWSQKKLKIV
eukprot:Nitzschia sp. Nitz4//scaffold369_size34440//23532//24692//NITZ4_007845-RA/size34440-processed-gene-0.43-mRNA-1//-1//CDS//3329549374//3718//frame0